MFSLMKGRCAHLVNLNLEPKLDCIRQQQNYIQQAPVWVAMPCTHFCQYCSRLTNNIKITQSSVSKSVSLLLDSVYSSKSNYTRGTQTASLGCTLTQPQHSQPPAFTTHTPRHMTASFHSQQPSSHTHNRTQTLVVSKVYTKNDNVPFLSGPLTLLIIIASWNTLTCSPKP